MQQTAGPPMATAKAAAAASRSKVTTPHASWFAGVTPRLGLQSRSGGGCSQGAGGRLCWRGITCPVPAPPPGQQMQHSLGAPCIHPSPHPRCYKHTGLTMQQVQDCVKDARLGKVWQQGRSGDGGSSGQGTIGASDGTKQHPVDSATGASDVHAPAPAADTKADLDGGAPRSKWAARASMSGALMAWFGIVGMFLSVLPRLYHRARRRVSLHDGPPVRHGMQSPRKLAV
jgi:hypothetical protein